MDKPWFINQSKLRTKANHNRQVKSGHVIGWWVDWSKTRGAFFSRPGDFFSKVVYHCLMMSLYLTFVDQVHIQQASQSQSNQMIQLPGGSQNGQNVIMMVPNRWTPILNALTHGIFSVAQLRAPQPTYSREFHSPGLKCWRRNLFMSMPNSITGNFSNIGQRGSEMLEEVIFSSVVLLSSVDLSNRVNGEKHHWKEKLKMDHKVSSGPVQDTETKAGPSKVGGRRSDTKGEEEVSSWVQTPARPQKGQRRRR